MIQKKELHPRNPHNGQYDFNALIKVHPLLDQFVAVNKYGNRSINFFDPAAVKALNCALLVLFYKIEYWNIAPNSLIPPIPSRADYIHYVSDLLGNPNKREQIRCLDIGVGANCIYPIIGSSEYGWEFVGCDIDSDSLKNAQEIVDKNSILCDRVELRLQRDKSSVFKGVVHLDEYFDLSICNPPFHDSQQSAQQGSLRKLRSLKGSKTKDIILNFGGTSSELWCDGGELHFIRLMMDQSLLYKRNFGWFTTLVSKEQHLDILCRLVKRMGVYDYRVMEMKQGNKKSRILAWRF